MLDQFLKVVYARSEREKLASKIAMHGMGGGEDDWLEKFKGTPLLPKALGLMQQGIQLEQQEMEAREKRDEEMDASRELWKMRDALCLQKRMLNLELATSELAQEMPAPPAMPPEAMGAASGMPPAGPAPTAPPPTGPALEPPPEVSEAGAAPEGLPGTPKMSAARMKMAAAKIKANKYAPPSAENMRLLQKLQDKREKNKKDSVSGFIQDALTTVGPEKKASIDISAKKMLMRKEALNVASLGRAMLGGAKMIGRGAKKGYETGGVLEALKRGGRNYANIAKVSPATAAGLAAVPLAGAGAAGLGAGAVLS